MGEKNNIESHLQNEKTATSDEMIDDKTTFFGGFSEDLIAEKASQERLDHLASKNLIKKINEVPDGQRESVFGDGEVFNPWRELYDVKIETKGEQKKKLAIFKEKLTCQKKGIAEMQKFLYAEIEKPEMPSAEELKTSIAEMKNKYALSQEQRDTFDAAIDICAQRHKGILENTADCIMKNGKLDGEKLFQKIFGRKPCGKVEVITKAITVYFKLFNINDYAYTSSGAYLEKRDPSKDEIMYARNTGGRKLANSQVPGMENVIALENVSRFSLPGFGKSSERILVHEEQHNFNCLIYDARAKAHEELFPADNENESEDSEVLKENIEEVDKEIKGRVERDSEIRFKVKDEICAYVIDGSSAIGIRDMLLEEYGLYEFGEYYKEENKKKGERFSREYVELVEGGIVAMFDFIKNGYSRQEAVSLLFTENLMRWRLVVDRQLGVEKNKKKEIRDRNKLNPILYRIDRAILNGVEKILKKIIG